jgi:crotonobetainyl-CoA:carnitine CoA-transferase CaiB-like acyl-CoA transferase
MTNSDVRERNGENRRAFIRQWAEYVRTHDDEEWARQQHKIVNSQLQSAKELSAKGDTDPAEFFRKKDEIARKHGKQD